MTTPFEAARASGGRTTLRLDPTLDVGSQAAALAGSQRRHPAGQRTLSRGDDTACPECGFDPGRLGAAAHQLRELVAAYGGILRHADDQALPAPMAEPAPFAAVVVLRDRLHAVANRLDRVLSDEDASVATVRVSPPAVLRCVPTVVALAQLDASAARLLRLIEQADDGQVGRHDAIIKALLHVAVHDGYRHLSSLRHGSDDAGRPLRGHGAQRSVPTHRSSLRSPVGLGRGRDPS